MICKTPLLHLLSCAVKLAQRPSRNEEFFAEGCQLKSVPNVFANLVHLMKIKLDGNKELGGLKWDVKRPSPLTTFSAKDCQMKHFPKFIPALSSLLCLYLKDSPIQFIPNKINCLKKLRTLDLGSCSLLEFPEAVTRLPSLTSLFLAQNKDITALPESLSKLHQLHQLDVSECSLTTFPKVVLKLTFLKCLYMNGNIHMRELHEGLRNLKELVHVNASRCGINEFPEFLLDYKGKECTFICYGNQVQILKETTVNKMLHLKLNTTKPAHTFGFSFRLLKVPPARVFKAGLKSCQKYYKDRKLHSSLSYHQQSVVLLGNTMAGKTSLLKTIAHKDMYLTADSDRTAVVEKVVIREYSSDGHTKKQIQLNVSDFGGHHIYGITYPLFLKASNQLVIICVDLSKYSSTKHDELVTKWIHTALCSMQSGHIMIAATKADQCEKGRKYTKWMHYIDWESNRNLQNERYQLQNGQLAENHMYKKLDTLKNSILEWKEKELNFIGKLIRRAMSSGDEESERSFRKKYHFLQEQDFPVIPTSSREQRWKGVHGIKSAILNYAHRWAMKLPQSWKHLLEYLDQKSDEGKRSWVSIIDLKRKWEQSIECDAGPQEFQLEECLQALSDCARVLWFPEKERLKNLVFHDGNKVVDAFKCIFNHKLDEKIKQKIAEQERGLLPIDIDTHLDQFQECGILSDVLLKVAWEKVDQRQVFLDVFKAFDLCFEVYGHHFKGFFFPWFVQKEGCDEFLMNNWPSEIPENEMQLEVHYKFGYRLPPTAYERLTVKMQTHLDPKVDFRNYWKDNVYFQHDGVNVIIRRCANEENPYIQFKLRSMMNNLYKLYALCYDLCHDMNDILLTCPGVVTDSYLVCPHCAILRARSPKLWRLQDVVMTDPPGDRKWVSCEMPNQMEQYTAHGTGATVPRHKRSCAATVARVPAAMIILSFIIDQHPSGHPDVGLIQQFCQDLHRNAQHMFNDFGPQIVTKGVNQGARRKETSCMARASSARAAPNHHFKQSTDATQPSPHVLRNPRSYGSSPGASHVPVRQHNMDQVAMHFINSSQEPGQYPSPSQTPSWYDPTQAQVKYSGLPQFHAPSDSQLQRQRRGTRGSRRAPIDK